MIHFKHRSNLSIIFIANHPDLKLADTYIDNGFTGTNFDRPEFERLMQDVKLGKIQCVVGKRPLPFLDEIIWRPAIIWRQSFPD